MKEGETYTGNKYDFVGTKGEGDCSLWTIGFNYILRQEPIGAIWVGSPFKKAMEVFHEQVKQEIDDYEINLDKEKRDAMKAMDTNTVNKHIMEAVPNAKRLNEIDSFFYNALLNLNDDVREILDLLVSDFLHQLLNDPDIFPPTSDATPITLRSRYVIELDSKLTDKVREYLSG